MNSNRRGELDLFQPILPPLPTPTISCRALSFQRVRKREYRSLLPNLPPLCLLLLESAGGTHRERVDEDFRKSFFVFALALQKQARKDATQLKKVVEEVMGWKSLCAVFSASVWVGLFCCDCSAHEFFMKINVVKRGFFEFISSGD